MPDHDDIEVGPVPRLGAPSARRRPGRPRKSVDKAGAARRGRPRRERAGDGPRAHEPYATPPGVGAAIGPVGPGPGAASDVRQDDVASRYERLLERIARETAKATWWRATIGHPHFRALESELEGLVKEARRALPYALRISHVRRLQSQIQVLEDVLARLRGRAEALGLRDAEAAVIDFEARHALFAPHLEDVRRRRAGAHAPETNDDAGNGSRREAAAGVWAPPPPNPTAASAAPPPVAETDPR